DVSVVAIDRAAGLAAATAADIDVRTHAAVGARRGIGDVTAGASAVAGVVGAGIAVRARRAGRFELAQMVTAIAVADIAVVTGFAAVARAVAARRRRVPLPPGADAALRPRRAGCPALIGRAAAAPCIERGTAREQRVRHGRPAVARERTELGVEASDVPRRV